MIQTKKNTIKIFVPRPYKMVEYMEYYNVTHEGDYANCRKGTGNFSYPNAERHCDDWGQKLTANYCSQTKVPDIVKEKNDILGFKPDKCCFFHRYNGERFCYPARADKMKEYMEYYDVVHEGDYVNCGTGNKHYEPDPIYKCNDWYEGRDTEVDCYTKATLSDK